MSFVLHSFPLFSPRMVTIRTLFPCPVSNVSFSFRVVEKSNYMVKRLACIAESKNSNPKPETNPTSDGPKSKPTKKNRARKSKVTKTEGSFPGMIPKKPRRGRRSEAAAVEDYVRDTLNRTFESIQKQNPEIMEKVEKIMKENADNSVGFDDDAAEDENDGDKEVRSSEEEMLVEDEDQDWPLDAEVGWGIRASEYFDQHPIRNTVGEDGTEINWEGEIDNGLVKEINCLEWESFAFHPSPLVVLVFERYNRANHNWKVLKELEKAAEVYWSAKDRLPPRTVKIDINIEKDLAYALKVKECPQILFLRGNTLLYREKDLRTSDELVQMMAHFYYNAKKPSCVNDAELTSNKWRRG